MAIEKLGNPKLKTQGTQARVAVDDLNSQLLLQEILIELRKLNVYLTMMTDEEVNGLEILGDIDE
jgi:hypothetical protein